MTSQEQNNQVGKAAVAIAVFSLLVKILGLVRVVVFAHEFGGGSLVGVYYASFRVPDFIYNLLILGTFSVVFIPVFSEYLLKDKEKANKLASNIITTTLLMIVVLIGLAFIFINPLVHAIVPGFSGEQFELTKKFTEIFLLSPLFFTLSSVASSILNSYKRFALMAAAPMFYNLSIIFGALVLYPKYGSTGLAWSVVLGAFLHFALLAPRVFSLGFRYTPFIDRLDPGFIKFWKLFWPRIFSMGTEQVTALTITIFGSFLGAKALASYYYADTLQSVVLGLFGISFAIAVFPILSDLFNNQDEKGFKDVLAKTVVQIMFFVIPLSILILILCAQIVRLILGALSNTNFDFDTTKLVAQSLGLFSFSLFAQSLIPLFNRAFYAMHNTKIPVIIGFVTIGSNIGLTYYFIGKFGIAGMALSFSITNILNLLLLMMELHHKLGNIHDDYVIVNCLKIVIASVVSAAAAYVSLYLLAPIVGTSTYLGIFLQGSISAVVSIAVYLLIGWGLGLSETRNLINLLRTTGQKVVRPLNIIFNLWS